MKIFIGTIVVSALTIAVCACVHKISTNKIKRVKPIRRS